MHGRQRINRHVQDARDFRGTLLSLDLVRDRHFLHPESLELGEPITPAFAAAAALVAAGLVPVNRRG
jgi:hypothetical protein